MKDRGKMAAHPCEAYVKIDVAPSVWCTGCGIGAVVNTFIQTVMKSSLGREQIRIIAGRGCTGKIPEYLKFGSPEVASDSVIKHAVGFGKQHPDSKTVVFVNDTDFFNADAQQMFEIGRVTGTFVMVYINNYVYYTLVQHRGIPNTPFMGVPLGHSEESPFNIPHMAKRAGASFIARWTQLHIRRIMYSLTDALQLSGFSVIEVISPCLMFYASNGIAGRKIDRLKYLEDHSVIKNGEPTENLDICHNDRIIVGRFIPEKEE